MRLYKKQKLCSTLAIDQLFSRGVDTNGCLAFPLRAVWRSNPSRRSDSPLQFLISIPKKRLRNATDRVKMRRRVREAFRLRQEDVQLPPDARIDVAFIYVDNKLNPYSRIEKAMTRILSQISKPAPCPDSSAS